MMAACGSSRRSPPHMLAYPQGWPAPVSDRHTNVLDRWVSVLLGATRQDGSTGAFALRQGSRETSAEQGDSEG